jgi:site-specific recombinase XerD
MYGVAAGTALHLHDGQHRFCLGGRDHRPSPTLRLDAPPTEKVDAYVTPAELDAILAAPDQATWHGRRDHALLVLAAQTGLRVSEITGLAIGDARLGTGAHVYCRGKGRKDRCTPLTSHTAGIIAEWIAERSAPPQAPLLCTRSGTPMSADAVARLTSKYAALAATASPALATKKITPHTMRHTAAMNLLHAGVDITVIALWLGHENPATTRIYLHADMKLKEDAIARTAPPGTEATRYKAPDTLLAFLDQL